MAPSSRRAVETSARPSTPLRRTSFRKWITCIRADDPRHERMTNDVVLVELHDAHVFDIAEARRSRSKTAALPCRKIDLRYVSRHDHLRVAAQAREKHFEL